jgi:diguanylate cyclase (GGDEF)-like protein
MKLSPSLHGSSKSKNKKSDASEVLTQVQQENELLRQQLLYVTETAAENETIWRHFAEIERILFRTRELAQLADELLQELKVRFHLDQAILLLCHPDLLERFFPEISVESAPIGEGTWILPFPMEMGSSLCSGTSKPFLLTPEDLEGLLHFLPSEVATTRSGVFIPLRVHQILFGGLFLGSTDADRYRPKDGTDLLEHLGMKIALCMDNCLAYERVKDFSIQDPLTGLLNYFQIQTILDKEFRKVRRTGEALSLLIIHLNFGHEIQEHFNMGNAFIKHAADLLNATLPEGESFLGRYGNDEFVVVLPKVGEEEAREVIPYLSQIIRKTPFRHENTVVLLQTIMGVGSLGKTTERSQDLLDAAYTELYRLKMSQVSLHP